MVELLYKSERLQEMADTDFLTDIGNRASLVERLERDIHWAKRTGKIVCADLKKGRQFFLHRTLSVSNRSIYLVRYYPRQLPAFCKIRAGKCPRCGERINIVRERLGKE